LSVLALVACAVFMKKTAREVRMMYIPMIFMMAVTFTALSVTIFSLGKQFVAGTLSVGFVLQLIFAILLLGLGVVVAYQGIQRLIGKDAKTLEVKDENMA
ncbi:MAG: hypothetical protein K2H85_09950, partial [Allobaculum sp.]|nr:hypothetical protein [Allobaculum sp.]